MPRYYSRCHFSLKQCLRYLKVGYFHGFYTHSLLSLTIVLVLIMVGGIFKKLYIFGLKVNLSAFGARHHPSLSCALLYVVLC